MRTIAQWCLVALTALAACTGVSVQKREDPRLPQLRAMGLRIAVMPFSVSAPDDAFLTGSLAPVGQLFALEGDAGLPDRRALGKILRGDVVAWLRQGSFDVVEPWVSDTQVAHGGLAAGMRDPSQAGAIARLLQVDAVLFGDVTRWNRSYYVLQSVAEVGLRLELRESNGTELFETERTEQIGSGITGGPTGFVSAATEPLAGLRGSQLRDLMRSTARDAALDLNGGSLGAMAGPLAPRLSFVAVQRQHDGPFLPGERIDVIAVGTPDCEVRFDLGRLRTGVPMLPTARQADPRGDRATYEGHYVVQAGDRAADLPVYCAIRREGQTRVQTSRYRWEGAVAVGPAAAAAGREAGASAGSSAQ
jgi:hypothetical protein